MKINLKSLLMNTTITIATVLMFFYYYMNVSFIPYIALVVMILPIFFIDLNQCVYMMAFYLAHNRLYKIKDGVTLIIFLSFAILLWQVFLKNRRIRKDIILSLLMMSLSVMLCVICGGKEILNSYLSFAVSTIILSVYHTRHCTYNLSKEYDQLKKYFVCGILSNILLGFLFALLNGQNLFGRRYSGINQDPNMYSMLIGTGISLLLLDTIESRNKRKGSNIILIFIFLFGAGLSISRGFLIGVSINVLLLLYMVIFKNKLTGIQKTGIVLMIILIPIIFGDLIQPILASYFDRFMSDNIETAGGRQVITTGYLDLWKSNIITIIFGIGHELRIIPAYGMEMAHHNYYVETLTTLGIFGVVSMIGIYFSFYRMIFTKNFKMKFHLIIPLLSYAIMLLALPSLFDELHLFTIFLFAVQYKAFLYKGT